MRIKGKRNRHLVVQIPGILIAAIEMTPDMIEIPDADEPQKPSKNVDKDKRVLFDLAHRLLFEIPDKYQNENEYYLLLSELKRTQARLTTFKGYTPATEAELALPLYMTSVKLDVGVETAESRIRKAISALKDSSLLKVRCQLYLAILSHDEALLQQLQTLFDTWRKTSLSPNQRSLIEEFSLLK